MVSNQSCKSSSLKHPQFFGISHLHHDLLSAFVSADLLYDLTREMGWSGSQGSCFHWVGLMVIFLASRSARCWVTIWSCLSKIIVICHQCCWPSALLPTFFLGLLTSNTWYDGHLARSLAGNLVEVLALLPNCCRSCLLVQIKDRRRGCLLIFTNRHQKHSKIKEK